MVLSIVAALACCASVTATAFAEGGPLWGYCADVTNGNENADCNGSGTVGVKALLNSSSETLLVLGLGLGLQLLKTGVAADTINCNTVAVHGYLSGGIPGTGSGLILYSNCTTPEKPGCTVKTSGEPAGSIATLPLGETLVYLTEAGAKALNSETAGALFVPENSSKVFAEIELSPGTPTCPLAGTPKVKGEQIVENESPRTPLLLRTVIAPTEAKIHYFAGMTGKKETIAELNFASIAATYSGKLSLDVTLLGVGKPPVAWWVCP
ncbi:MAG TPA: hypothetical protein VMB51_01915 [Solirubrobacteraceae bacterium]|nr:hypothetical protein [Solirubrobacteraceae bacterium]